jgi:hypothetical protein
LQKDKCSVFQEEWYSGKEDTTQRPLPLKACGKRTATVEIEALFIGEDEN